ncbi:MAG: hypothetical protein LPJ89_09310 [Hymenobacteraceae bacterium]|nr:hypothetical protein [Hymenobacteraceae bacterium]
MQSHNPAHDFSRGKRFSLNSKIGFELIFAKAAQNQYKKNGRYYKSSGRFN